MFESKDLLKGVCIVICVLICGCGLMRGCSEQSMTKNWGGEMEVTLEPNEKLVNVTWKDDSMWFLTREMTSEDVAESYSFYEKDVTGWLEGVVYINEVKMTDEELEEYEAIKTLEKDYSNAGNVDAYGNVIFIQYDMENNTYIKLKDYTYDENGILIAK